jgi:hypothetical protein
MSLYKYILLCFSLLLLTGQLKAQVTELEIWQIQGSGISSPYKDSTIITSRNIVTLVTNDRFFIQTPPERSDNDPATSDGIMVYVGNQVSFEAGDLVTVSGSIQEYFELTEFGPNGLSFSLDSTGVALPPSFALDETIPSDEPQPIPDLEKLEGMRVIFNDATATGPGNGNILPITFKPNRPFREPGIKYPGISGLPVWDGNPEVIELNLNWSGGAPYSSGVNISGVGVLSFSNGLYQIIPNDVEIVGDRVIQPVRNKEELEATIGSLNCFVFTNTSSDFSARVYKIANYVIDQLKAPDILAVQEVRDLSTLQALAAKIHEFRPDITYDAYLELGNQSGSFQINNGFLVRNTVQDIQISQWAADELLSLGGFLHDRPPLLLEGNFATEPPTPIKVLNLHLRSLGGIEGNNSNYVRTKRWEASISVANIIRDLQFQNLVVVGDYNAFQFSDGYVDVLAQLTGNTSLGAEFPVMEIIEPPLLINHSLSVPPEEQYSYIFDGNAQILDHCISTELEGLTVNELQYARGNSDNPDSDVNNTFVPYRASDHDGFVLFLGLNDSLSVGTQEVQPVGIEWYFKNPFEKESAITFQLTDAKAVKIELIDNLGRSLFEKEWKTLEAGIHTFTPGWDLPTGIYYLVLKTEGHVSSKKLILK